MSKVDYPGDIRNLIARFRQLPGIGPRSAERIVLWLMKSGASQIGALSEALQAVQKGVLICQECGFFADSRTGCSICQDPARDASLLCVVEQTADILPLERTGAWSGVYHVLHGRISPLDNVGPEDLSIGRLLTRLRAGQVREMVLATGSDVEGEATANYLSESILREFPHVTVTRLAQGLPAGGGLDSADELTLYRALSGRRAVNG